MRPWPAAVLRKPRPCSEPHPLQSLRTAVVSGGANNIPMCRGGMALRCRMMAVTATAWRAGRRRSGGGGGSGRAVQVDPIKPTLKAPVIKLSKLTCDKPLSKFAFKFRLRRYTVGARGRSAAAAAPRTVAPLAAGPAYRTGASTTGAAYCTRTPQGGGPADRCVNFFSADIPRGAALLFRGRQTIGGRVGGRGGGGGGGGDGRGDEGG